MELGMFSTLARRCVWIRVWERALDRSSMRRAAVAASTGSWPVSVGCWDL